MVCLYFSEQKNRNRGEVNRGKKETVVWIRIWRREGKYSQDVKKIIGEKINNTGTHLPLPNVITKVLQLQHMDFQLN